MAPLIQGSLKPLQRLSYHSKHAICHRCNCYGTHLDDSAKKTRKALRSKNLGNFTKIKLPQTGLNNATSKEIETKGHISIFQVGLLNWIRQRKINSWEDDIAQRKRSGFSPSCPGFDSRCRLVSGLPKIDKTVRCSAKNLFIVSSVN